MSELYFVTSNKNKFEQAKAVLPMIKRFDFDSPEIQSLDGKEILENKLKEISRVKQGRFFCEDVSLEIEGLNGLPGPFVKWFVESLKVEGVADAAIKSGNPTAYSKIVLGYSDNGKVKFFEVSMKGTLVTPRGENGFGFDRSFLPEGSDKTLGEMSMEEKNQYSMRAKALIKLKEFLDNGEK